MFMCECLITFPLGKKERKKEKENVMMFKKKECEVDRQTEYV